MKRHIGEMKTKLQYLSSPDTLLWITEFKVANWLVQNLHIYCALQL